MTRLLQHVDVERVVVHGSPVEADPARLRVAIEASVADAVGRAPMGMPALERAVATGVETALGGRRGDG